MNKNAHLAFTSVLAIAVGMLFVLHFTSKPTTTAPSAKSAQAVAPLATLDSGAATEPAEQPVVDAAGDTAVIRRVGYVKSGELLEGYKGMQTARTAYEAKMARWEREHQEAVAAFQSAVQQYQAKAGGMLDGQRAEQEQKLQAQEQQVAQRQQQLQQQAAEEEAKLNEQVLGKVNKLLERYGKANNYDLILVAGNGSVAYGRPGLDLTKIILDQLNAEYAAGKK
jgi:outer membrane protein